MNGFDNTNDESALTKQFKTNGCVGLQQSNNNDSETSDRKAPDEPPEGSWWTKVSLGCLVAPSEFRRPSKKVGILSEYFRKPEFRKYTDSDPFRWPSELSESDSE